MNNPKARRLLNNQFGGLWLNAAGMIFCANAKSLTETE